MNDVPGSASPRDGVPGAAHPQAGYLKMLSATGRGLSESRISGTNGAKPGIPEQGDGIPSRSQSLAALSLLVLVLAVPAWAAERREAVDADKNGKPEEWKVYDGDALVRIERDRDGDGTAEVQITLENGKPVRSEVDRNKDGKPDVIRWSQDGKPVREQADLNLDGRVDGWIFYKEGVKDLTILDKNFDGKPDAWFYYGQAGLKLVGGRIDENFDGKPDRTFGTFPDKEDRKPW